MNAGIVDYFLNRLSREKDIFFVQVGANDGVQADPVYRHVQRHHWRGLLIEPLPDLFAQLQHNYRESPQLILENCAVGDVPELTLHRINPHTQAELPAWCSGLASFDRDIILGHATEFPDLVHHLISEVVPCATLNGLFDRHHINQVDLLLCDTEGYDRQIMDMFDLARFHPKMVLFEKKHLSASDTKHVHTNLEANGYVCIDVANDTLGVARSWSHEPDGCDFEVMAGLQSLAVASERVNNFLKRGGVFQVSLDPVFSLERLSPDCIPRNG
jgi:FkbM family methyltransferase